MEPIIGAIPTFGTCSVSYHAKSWYKPAETKYSAEPGDKDDPDRWDSPVIVSPRAEEG
jgi:hypothetical protein